MGGPPAPLSKDPDWTGNSPPGGGTRAPVAPGPAPGPDHLRGVGGCTPLVHPLPVGLLRVARAPRSRAPVPDARRPPWGQEQACVARVVHGADQDPAARKPPFASLWDPVHSSARDVMLTRSALDIITSVMSDRQREHCYVTCDPTTRFTSSLHDRRTSYALRVSRSLSFTTARCNVTSIM